jgi:hypothetical protein
MVPTKLPKEDNASWEGNAASVVRLARVNASKFWLNQQVFRIQGHRLLVYKYVEGLGHCDPAPDHGEHGNHHPQGDGGRRAIFVSFVWCLSRRGQSGSVWPSGPENVKNVGVRKIRQHAVVLHEVLRKSVVTKRRCCHDCDGAFRF